MTEEKLLRVEELAILIQVSVQTINNWYRWKNLYPEHKLSIYLPEYIQKGARQTRYWRYADVWMIIQFKNAIPHGRNGILSDVTQRQYKKKKVEKNENESK